MQKTKQHLKNPEKYEEAKALHRKGLSFGKIEKMIGIPKSTLYDHIKGQYTGQVTTSGPDPILTKEDEESIVDCVEYIASRGISVCRQHLRALIREAVLRKGLQACKMNLDTGPSNEYMRKFIKRHEKRLVPIMITDTHPPKISNKMFGNHDQVHVDQFFSVLEEFMVKHDIKDDPSRLYVMCEYFFSGQLKSSKKVVTMVVPEGPSFEYRAQVTVPDHITVVQATSATGQNCPTLTIFPGHVPKASHPIDESVLLMQSTTDGRMNKEMMLSWFEEVFLSSVGETRPLLLLLDTNKYHWSPSLINKAKQNSVEILYLPSHATYLLQPLNVHFQELKQEVADLAVSQGCLGCRKLSESFFADILRQALNKKLGSSVISSFAETGIFPLKRKTVQELNVRYCAQTEDWKKFHVCENSDSDVCKTCGKVEEDSAIKLELVQD